MLTYCFFSCSVFFKNIFNIFLSQIIPRDPNLGHDWYKVGNRCSRPSYGNSQSQWFFIFVFLKTITVTPPWVIMSPWPDSKSLTVLSTADMTSQNVWITWFYMYAPAGKKTGERKSFSNNNVSEIEWHKYLPPPPPDWKPLVTYISKSSVIWRRVS